MDSPERQPLLHPPNQQHNQHPTSPASPTSWPDADTLPGLNPSKSLNWSSAYILVVSRVIGSGIFATPGSIVQSAGSIGLTLLVWIVGTVLAACGLAVSMEFGCMLPRSGGDKVGSMRGTLLLGFG